MSFSSYTDEPGPGERKEQRDGVRAQDRTSADHTGKQFCPAAAPEQHEEEPGQPDRGKHAARDHQAYRGEF